MTLGRLIDGTPVDLVDDLSLTPGSIYEIALIASAAGRLHVGGASRPGSGDPYLPLAEGRSVTLQIGGDPVWAYTSGPASRLSVTRLRAELGPLRDRVAVDVSSDDFVRPSGFVLQVGGSGSVIYRTLDGDSDITENFSAAGVVSVANVPVLLQAVRTGSMATGLVAGLL